MKKIIENQFENRFLWAPFIAAFGSAVYFFMRTEPVVAYPFLIATLCALVLLLRRTNILLSAALLFIFGFFYTCGFTRFINTPRIEHNISNVSITGIVKDIDYAGDKVRIFISVPANQITKDNYNGQMATLRLSINSDEKIPEIGRTVSATVTLFKPGSADVPNGFDYAGWTYFNSITATGFINKYNANFDKSGDTKNINTLRNKIHNKTNSFLSDALVLGYKNTVPDRDVQIWKSNGLSHIWSISGFHMTLVGGWLFAFFYLIFRSVAPISRLIPARYPAMILSFTGLFFYLYLSGSNVATMRAFFMTALTFIAFFFDRNIISLRNVCIVFFVLFLVNPHYIIEPGFELSFAAIFGLVWYFNKTTFSNLTFPARAIRMVKAAAATSIIATIFTAPFVAYHFYSLPAYGLIGNLILLPIFSFAIMPLVIIGTISAFFGLFLPLIWASDIYNLALGFASTIADLPFAVINTPQISPVSLGFITIGFLCLMFIKNLDAPKILKRANLLLFFCFASVGIAIVQATPRPVLYSTFDNELIGFVQNKKLIFNKAKSSNHFFTFDSWKQFNNEPAGTKNIKYKCKSGVCIYKTENWSAAYMQKFVPLSGNINYFCNDKNTNFVFSYFHFESNKCSDKIKRGAFVIYKSGRIEFISQNRWWHNPH